MLIYQIIMVILFKEFVPLLIDNCDSVVENKINIENFEDKNLLDLSLIKFDKYKSLS